MLVRVSFVGPRTARVLFMFSVFLDRTYSYLLVRSGDSYNHYIRLCEGTIELVRFHKESELVLRLKPYTRHSLAHAALVYLKSTLPKSEEATAVLEAVVANRDDDRINFLVEQEKLEKMSKRERVTQKSNQISLEQICEELKITPSRARGIFRRNRVEKPGARWEWDKGQRDQVVKELQKFL